MTAIYIDTDSTRATAARLRGGAATFEESAIELARSQLPEMPWHIEAQTRAAIRATEWTFSAVGAELAQDSCALTTSIDRFVASQTFAYRPRPWMVGLDWLARNVALPAGEASLETMEFYRYIAPYLRSTGAVRGHFRTIPWSQVRFSINKMAILGGLVTAAESMEEQLRADMIDPTVPPDEYFWRAGRRGAIAATGSILGGAAGSVIGFALGGPVGAFIGSWIGSSLGAWAGDQIGQATIDPGLALDTAARDIQEFVHKVTDPAGTLRDAAAVAGTAIGSFVGDVGSAFGALFGCSKAPVLVAA